MKDPFIKKLQKKLPGVKFVQSNIFYWSPGTKTIHMQLEALEKDEGRWSLLHEVGHALLQHQSYHTDAGLLTLEAAAWHTARDVGKKLQIDIPYEHIQDCLNTYRDWLYARSACPVCNLNSLQIDPTTYLCLNCSTRWSVSPSRFCRPYRMQDRHKKIPSELPQTVFR